jgi:hypothetical protein
MAKLIKHIENPPPVITYKLELTAQEAANLFTLLEGGVSRNTITQLGLCQLNEELRTQFFSQASPV